MWAEWVSGVLTIWVYFPAEFLELAQTAVAIMLATVVIYIARTVVSIVLG
ncbi:MAG: hypothetical protein QXI60_08335 [Thermofilaceae archaeon]